MTAEPFEDPPPLPEPFDAEVSIVPNATDTRTSTTTLRKALNAIRSGKWATKIARLRQAYEQAASEPDATPDSIRNATGALKKALPAALFSGTFSERHDKHLLVHSGLICADLDHLDGRLTEIKQATRSDPHVLAAFTSPTGTGLKVIFRAPPGSEHHDAFRACRQHVARTYGLPIDEACKNVSRMCFVSYDPELYAADDASPLPPAAPEPPREFVAPHPAAPAGTLRAGDDYNARGDVVALLTKHGWTQKDDHGWIRPGKTKDIGATWNHIPDRFHVFTSSAPPLLPNHTYQKWHLYGILEHGGDWQAAAKALASQGYGTPPRKQSKEDEPTPLYIAPQRSPFSFNIPPPGDQSILLGNRYLNRGDAIVFSGSSGIGKSSAQAQMAADFALGTPFHGIAPNGPLLQLIIQSEDSEGDVGEIWGSLRHVRQLTQAQVADIDSRVRIITDRVNRGFRFLTALRQHLADFAATHDGRTPDIVWLNPLQAFVDGDITESRDLGAFLREGLNSIAADPDPTKPPRFGYIIVHHTTKPATGKERSERLWHEVMYDMAGGAELINWARGIMSLRPTPTEGDFNLVLAKRGRRAGVTKEVKDGWSTTRVPVTTIPLRHAKGTFTHNGQTIPLIYWESRPEDEPVAESNKGGRTEKYAFSHYRDLFPPHDTPGLAIGELHRALLKNGEIPKKGLHEVCTRWRDDGFVEILDGVQGQARRYRKTPEADGHLRGIPQK